MRIYFSAILCSNQILVVYITVIQIDNEANKYRLHISPVRAGNLTSTGRDRLYAENNGRYFTTFDINNSVEDAANCAREREAGYTVLSARS